MLILILAILKTMIIIILTKSKLLSLISASFIYTISFLFVYFFGALAYFFLNFNDISFVTGIYLFIVWFLFVSFECVVFKSLCKKNQESIRVILRDNILKFNINILGTIFIYASINYFFVSQLLNFMYFFDGNGINHIRSCYIYPDIKGCEFNYLPFHGLISILSEISYILLLLNIIINKKMRKHVFLVVLYLVSCLLSAERIMFVDSVIVILALIVLNIFLEKNNKNMIKLCIYSIVFISLFVSLGISGNNEIDLLKYIVKYFGFPLYGLNELITNPEMFNNFDVRVNFRVIREVLSNFSEIAPLEKPNLSFTTINGVSSNIYTSFFRYILEFGFFISFLLVAIMGTFYGFLNYIMIKFKSIFGSMLYLLTIFPLPMVLIEERFYNILIGLNIAKYIFFLLMIVVFSKMVIKK